MIQIRELQHYLYCPHRWGMLYHDGEWVENYHTVKAELAHDRVHSGKILSRSKSKIILGGVYIYSEKRKLYGKTDCLELTLDHSGVKIEEFPSCYRLSVIEYKPTHPKGEVHFADRMQLYAQKVCLEERFRCEVESFLYYADTGKRVRVTFGEEDEKALDLLMAELNKRKERDETPPAEYGDRCNGCSVREKCMPKRSKRPFREEVMRDLT